MAIATGCNPGSSPLASPLMAAHMACVLFGLTPFHFEPIDSYFDRYSALHDCYCYSSDYPHVEGGIDIKAVQQGRLARFGEDVLNKFFMSNGEWLVPAASPASGACAPASAAAATSDAGSACAVPSGTSSSPASNEHPDRQRDKHKLAHNRSLRTPLNLFFAGAFF